MNAKLFVVFLVVGLLPAGAAYAEEPSPDLKSALAPLGRFAGSWEKRFTIYKSEWSPEEQVRTGTHSCKWILDERHFQETGRDSDGATYISIYSYDAGTKAYRMSVFQSNGNSWQMTGKWDAGSNTFTWSRKMDDGIRMTSSYQLVSPDEFKFNFVAKKDAGKVYFRLEGTGKRVEARKK